ncbi:MAG: class I SAM-dependent RNA methyltransferase [bacterium]|nr:class I SAM-dependent RNA methyltransferase [bacterium]
MTAESSPVVVEIDSLAAGGDGVGRLADGRVVFVAWTAPGDQVLVRLIEERKRFARGEVVELLRPGPDRRSPPCPIAGKCGGCAWQHLAYPAQLAAKVGILRDAIERIAGLTPPVEIPVQSADELGYRSRARVFAEAGEVGFRRMRSHEVCGTRNCPVLVPELDAVLGSLAEAPPEGEAEWLLAVGDAGEVSVRVDGPGAKASAIHLRVGDDSLRIGPGVFFQANAALRNQLAQAVSEACGRGERALELYAGAGFFTLGLSRAFGQVTAVESNRRAARDLGHNLKAAEVPADVAIRPIPTEDYLADPRDPRPDLVLLDPPRTGLAKGGPEALAALGAERIVYLSCDPATLARDLRILTERGYELSAVTAFDLFPQTPHIEALAILTL